MKSAELFKTINWLEEMGIENYSINPDLSIDVDGNVNLSRKGLTEIPIQFGVVTGWFDCKNNQLTSLQGAPKEVGESFDCKNNQLTSLQGAPKEVGGMFWCNENKLTSLQGAPEIVGGEFDCDNNQLTSLQGAPREVGDSFYCSENKLTSLQGAPEIVGESFWCRNNKKKFTEEEVKAICKVKWYVYI